MFSVLNVATVATSNSTRHLGGPFMEILKNYPSLKTKEFFQTAVLGHIGDLGNKLDYQDMDGVLSHGVCIHCKSNFKVFFISI